MFARCRDIVIRTDPVGRENDRASLLVTVRRFTPAPGEGAPRRRRVEDGLDLVLARQAAEAAGLTMQLRQEVQLVSLSVQFPKAFTDAGGGMASIELPARGKVSNVPEWVLVISADTGLVSSAAFGLGQAAFETRGAQSARDARALLREWPVGLRNLLHTNEPTTSLASKVAGSSLYGCWHLTWIHLGIAGCIAGGCCSM